MLEKYQGGPNQKNDETPQDERVHPGRIAISRHLIAVKHPANNVLCRACRRDAQLVWPPAAPDCNPALRFPHHWPDMPRKQIGTRQKAVTRARRRLGQIQRTGAKFLTTDLDLAMTLTRIAGDADTDSKKRNRNQANARQAYNDVSRISHHASLTDNERLDVDSKLAELRSALEQLGEVFA